MSDIPYFYNLSDLLGTDWPYAHQLFKQCQEPNYDGEDFCTRLEKEVLDERRLHQRLQYPAPMGVVSRAVEYIFMLGLKREYENHNRDEVMADQGGPIAQAAAAVDMAERERMMAALMGRAQQIAPAEAQAYRQVQEARPAPANLWGHTTATAPPGQIYQHVRGEMIMWYWDDANGRYIRQNEPEPQ
jgi:hypothetical protein